MKKKIVMACVLLAIVMALSLAAIFVTDIFIIENVSVSSQDDSMIGKGFGESICGKNIFLVDYDEAARQIGSDPKIQSVSFKRVYPDSIEVEVLTRELAVGIEYMNGVIGISSDGYVMDFIPMVGEGEDSGNESFLLVKGFPFDRFKLNSVFVTVDYDSLENVILLSKFLKSHIDESVVCAIIEDNDLVLQIDKDFRAEFGKSDEPIEGKLMKFKMILDDLNRKGINRGIIDLRYESSPVYYPIR